MNRAVPGGDPAEDFYLCSTEDGISGTPQQLVEHLGGQIVLPTGIAVFGRYATNNDGDTFAIERDLGGTQSNRPNEVSPCYRGPTSCGPHAR